MKSASSGLHDSWVLASHDRRVASVPPYSGEPARRASGGWLGDECQNLVNDTITYVRRNVILGLMLVLHGLVSDLLFPLRKVTYVGFVKDDGQHLPFNFSLV